LCVDNELGRRGKALVLLGSRLARIGSERRDIDEAGHFGMIPGLGDHRTSPAMSHQDDESRLTLDHPAGRVDIILE
jgi:hypothetical protein